MTTQTSQRMARVEVRFGVMRVQRHGAYEIAERLIGSKKAHQHCATIVGGFGGTLIQHDSLVESGDGFLVTLEEREGDPALEVGIKVTRVERPSALEARQRLGWPTELQIRLAAPQMRRSRCRTHLQSAIEARGGLRMALEMHQRQAPIVMRRQLV